MGPWLYEINLEGKRWWWTLEGARDVGVMGDEHVEQTWGGGNLGVGGPSKGPMRVHQGVVRKVDRQNGSLAGWHLR